MTGPEDRIPARIFRAALLGAMLALEQARIER